MTHIEAGNVIEPGLTPLEEEPCPGCGDGDKVPAHGYWRCPVCDAEWHDDDEPGDLEMLHMDAVMAFERYREAKKRHERASQN